MTSCVNAGGGHGRLAVDTPRGRRVITSSAGSASRLAADKEHVAKELASSSVQDSLERVMRPKSISGGMKKIGIALVAAPDPVTGVPGVALLATSYAMKRKEPAGLGSLAKETKKVLREMESLRI